jgi:hypothetical protein
MQIKVTLSSQHYLLDGLIYSSTNVGDSPLAVMSSLAAGDVERAEFAKKFNLILPGTAGTVVGTTSVLGAPRFAVLFEGTAGVVPVPGKFLSQVE